MSSAAPPPRGPLGRLADLAFRRRRAVVAVWVVGLVAAFAAAGLAGDWSADYSTPGSESRAAADLLQERFPQSSPDTVDVVWQAPDGLVWLFYVVRYGDTWSTSRVQFKVSRDHAETWSEE